MIGPLRKFFVQRNKSHALENRFENFAHSVAGHFNKLKEDFELQKENLEKLSDFSEDIHKDYKNHCSVTASEVNYLKSQINQLYTHQSRQQNDLEKMQESFSEFISVIGRAFNDMHGRIEVVENNQNQRNTGFFDEVKRLFSEKTVGTKPENSSSADYHKSHFLENSNSKGYSTLTNPETKLLNILMNEKDPISYSRIAENTGNSINTVRVVMNNLKKKGVVEENVLPNGQKLFSAKNKEKIKKIYNLSKI
ncbi:MAG: winged helix-turn-helix domain-containing protein [Nanobdellota archaeon]